MGGYGMTREEQIHIAMKESVTETIYSSGYGFTTKATDLLEAAWEKGATWADKTMIDNVCKWIEQHQEDYNKYDAWKGDYIDVDALINDFKKSMQNE